MSISKRLAQLENAYQPKVSPNDGWEQLLKHLQLVASRTDLDNVTEEELTSQSASFALAVGLYGPCPPTQIVRTKLEKLRASDSSTGKLAAFILGFGPETAGSQTSEAV